MRTKKNKNINNEVMKKNNMRVVLDVIREKQKISRRDITKEVGLTSSSVTNIVNDLMSEGYVIEAGVEESGGGRKPIILQLNPDSGYVIGVELTVINIICVIVNIKSEIIDQKIIGTSIEKGQDFVIGQIIDLINEMIKHNNINRDKILGVGVVSAGPFNWKDGIMLNPPNFTGWERVPIRSAIKDALGIKTFFEKDSSSAAIAEYWFGRAKGIQSIFVVNAYDVGLGGGILINGDIYRAFMDGAGDLGHMTVDIDGELCTCGNRGCLETISSGLSLLNKVKDELRKGRHSSILDSVNSIDDIDFNTIIQMANQGDPLCLEVFRRGAKYLGMAISNIINLFSPEMIVLGGSFINNCPIYAQLAIEYSRKNKYPPYAKDVKILTTKLGEIQGALGGVAAVFADFFKGH